MKLLILVGAFCMVAALNQAHAGFAMSYHHTMTISGKTYYCNNRNDCRTKEEWQDFWSHYQEEVVYHHDINPVKPVNRYPED